MGIVRASWLAIFGPRLQPRVMHIEWQCERVGLYPELWQLVPDFGP